MVNRRIFRMFREGEARTGNTSAVRRLRNGKVPKKSFVFYSESGETDLTEFVGSCYDGAAIKALIV